MWSVTRGAAALSGPAVLVWALQRRSSTCDASRSPRSHAAKEIQDRAAAICERFGPHLAAADKPENDRLAWALKRLDQQSGKATAGPGHKARLLRDASGLSSWMDEFGDITIVQATVKAAPRDVATAVWHLNARSKWDARVERSEVLETPELEMHADSMRTIYLRGRSGAGWRSFLLRDRDVVFTMCRTPVGALGRAAKESFASDLYVLVDRHDLVADEPGCTRARVNGLVLLRPIAAGTMTQVVTVTELKPQGWSPALWALGLGYPRHMHAEEDLKALKAFIEDVVDDALNAKNEAETSAAMERLKGEGGEHESASLVNAVGSFVSHEELRALRETLRAKRGKIIAEEKSLGLDLTDLKKQIDRDLRTVERRLRTGRRRTSKST